MATPQEIKSILQKMKQLSDTERVKIGDTQRSVAKLGDWANLTPEIFEDLRTALLQMNSRYQKYLDFQSQSIGTVINAIDGETMVCDDEDLDADL